MLWARILGDQTDLLLGFGVGLELLSMARDNRLISWPQGLPAFRQAVEAEARRRGLPLPPGYNEMLAPLRSA